VYSVSELLTIQVGPEDILVAAGLELLDELSTPPVEHVMDKLQRERAPRCRGRPAGLHRPDATRGSRATAAAVSVT